jgi:undecaprenyl phosphate-alpha-L-ara4N flippase subunit ArnE
MKDSARIEDFATMKDPAAKLLAGQPATATQRTGVLLMILSALFASFGQLFYKLSASGASASGADEPESLLYLIVGLALYSAGGIVMMQAYKRGRLSILQPLLALANVFAVFIAVFLLGEAVTPLRLLAVAAIVAGAVVLGGCDE